MRTCVANVLLLSVLCSVTAISQTTIEEYNYVTKGYKVQLESGLDMKKGYRFEDIHSIHIEYSNGVIRETDFKALLRDGQKLPAAILCIYTHPDNNMKDYICIPQFNSSKEVWDSTYSKISAVTPENTSAFMWGLAKLSSYYSMK